MSSDNKYMSEYMLDRYNKRKQLAIKQLGGKCVQCGSMELLEFDHIDSNIKEFTIGKLLAGISEEKLQDELKKCQLLCKECHTKKHAAVCGTLGGYRYCKCNKCKEAKRLYTIEYRKTHKRIR